MEAGSSGAGSLESGLLVGGAANELPIDFRDAPCECAVEVGEFGRPFPALGGAEASDEEMVTRMPRDRSRCGSRQCSLLLDRREWNGLVENGTVGMAVLTGEPLRAVDSDVCLGGRDLRMKVLEGRDGKLLLATRTRGVVEQNQVGTQTFDVSRFDVLPAKEFDGSEGCLGLRVEVAEEGDRVSRPGERTGDGPGAGGCSSHDVSDIADLKDVHSPSLSHRPGRGWRFDHFRMKAARSVCHC